jgi:hypothetical protein
MINKLFAAKAPNIETYFVFYFRPQVAFLERLCTVVKNISEIQEIEICPLGHSTPIKVLAS